MTTIEYFFSKKQRILFISLAVIGILISVILQTVFAEPTIQLNTIEKSYGQMLVIRGNEFTPDTEYTIKLVTPNNFELILQTGLTKDEIGITHPIEFDAMKGTYQIIIETDIGEKATSNFNFDQEITTQYKVFVESNVPYGGNVAQNIDNFENATVIISSNTEVTEFDSNTILNTSSITSNETQIPSWIKDVFVMWANGQISDQELLDGIRYLVNINVILVS